MNKQELVKAIYERQEPLGLTLAGVSEFVDAIVHVITGELVKKEKITLFGFGTFTTANRKAKNGVNPATGKAIKIAAKTVPVFKAGQQLKELVNS